MPAKRKTSESSSEEEEYKALKAPKKAKGKSAEQGGTYNPWSPEERAEMLEIVLAMAKVGKRGWGVMTEKYGRSEKQCYDQWVKTLLPRIRKAVEAV